MRRNGADIANRPGGFNPRICKRCDKGDKLYIEGELSFNPRICKRCDQCAKRNN